ncbi:CP4-6 prophage; putative 2-keto-3-deoxygluconate aldolase [Rhodovastum atsumiense]|uniref:Dihydrodipicolinate synthase family protein n=1 Tax=Rhodovastum atsumiense TaxID=504468 RepID=A0A5M6IPU5_9PROT|nr:dihydrodipicolinate synthase family protein [Rhodovastum atsumiense]KAA5610281.1 dihydrodipicolinate synthase family protein [Rhodovastum atsumiense]CAH2602232.1 CP4-6 prophage; putative 2-keto-3-deoxygluconate aldolase [Rhodovastum atsumiense]
MPQAALRGVIPPVATIFDDNGQFHPAGMGVVIDRVLASPVNGMLFLGSAGEFAHLATPVRKAIAEFCIDRVAGRRPVIVGTAAAGTAEAIDLARHAEKSGADAIIVVNPYYTTLSEARLEAHYRAIADAVELPILLYNFPGMTKQELSVELVQRLALACPNIVGIKDTVDCMSHIRRLIVEVKAARPDFLVFCGYDEYLLDTLLLGGDGVIPASANFAPELTCGIYAAQQRGDLAAIVPLMRRLAVLSSMYAIDTPFYGLLKEALRLTGSDIPTGVVAPATPPDAATKQRLVEVLVRAGILPG